MMMAKKKTKPEATEATNKPTDNKGHSDYKAGIEAEKLLAAVMKADAKARSKYDYYKTKWEKQLSTLKSKIKDQSKEIEEIRKIYIDRSWASNENDWKERVDTVRETTKTENKYKPPKKSTSGSGAGGKSTGKRLSTVDIYKYLSEVLGSITDTHVSWSAVSNGYKNLTGKTLQQKDKFSEVFRSNLDTVPDGISKLLNVKQMKEDIDSAIAKLVEDKKE